jgi:thioester reductase-like protein
MLGSELTAKLAQAGHAITAMVNQTAELRCNDGQLIPTIPQSTPLVTRAGMVTLLHGNVREPRCALDQGLYQRLIDSSDLIIHCAAITEFGRAPHVYAAVNVDGTANVIALALNPRRQPIPLIYVSTAYISGDRDGLILETDLDKAQGFGNPYEQSKFEAEKLVQGAAAQGLPAIVVRPSIVVGDSATGRIREFKNIYPILKVVTQRKVRSIPGHYDATLDLVSIDYVTATVSVIAELYHKLEGRTFHVVSGEPVTLRDFSDVLAEYPSLFVPRFVPIYAFDSHLLPIYERRYYERIVRLYESYFLRKVSFCNESTMSITRNIKPLGGKSLLRTLINYCEQVDYLNGPESKHMECLRT